MRHKGLVITAIVFAVLLIILLALPLLIDVNRFRPMIEGQLQEALGRKVTIASLEFSWLAGGVRAQNIAIAEDPSFGQQPFLTAKSLDVGVDILPLILSRTLHVTSLNLVEPNVRLVHGSGGRWNFSTLGATSAPSAPVRSGRQKGAPESAPAAPDFSVDRLKISDGRIQVASAANPGRASTYSNVDLNASNISFHSVVPFTLDAQTPGGGSINLQGRAGPVDRENAAQTPVNASVKVRKLDLASTGFVDSSSGIAGIIDYDGQLRSDGKRATTDGKITANRLRVVRGGSPASEPVTFDYASEYDLARESGELTRGNIGLGHTAAHLAGNYSTQGESTVVHMRLTGNNMPVGDIEGLLPALGVILPPGASLQGGTANANLALDGPIDRLVVSGPVNVNNTRLAGFNLGAKMKAIASLAGIQPGNNTDIQLLSSNLRVAPEGIDAQDLNMVVPAIGTLTGSGTIGNGNALNFHILAKLAHGGGALGALSSLSSLGQSKGQIPFMIQGTTSSPVILPDLGKAIGNTITSPAQGVTGVLNGLFGHHK